MLQLQDPAETRPAAAPASCRAGEAETGRAFVTRGGRRWVDPDAVARELKRAGIDHLLMRTGPAVRRRPAELLQGPQPARPREAVRV